MNLLVPMGVRSNQAQIDITDIGHERAKTSGLTLLVTTRFPATKHIFLVKE